MPDRDCRPQFEGKISHRCRCRSGRPKKVNSLLTQDCQILVISDSANTQITNYAKNGKIEFKKTRLDNADFLEEYDPILVMAATDDRELNRKIVQKAKKKERTHTQQMTPTLATLRTRL
ncbi:NAD(P)-dependent oxidoreductase [Candidatus Nitrosotenuis chungbukensis]|uniref:NAD(P)-dependent oxidoreductase n=1 Tax=Candidatus Nitrosotenuis chungbukensis TaxID=1353246 RepID=UPI00267100A4|nr:NAD(P)-dependent oxidoreductase [Candidatus Nitrosotenuis chungbukensis]WKT57113.1 NAD(P)-dependent oxidoreductase [Candidatus Nitrosotenuis chungbukensis]